MNVVLVTSRVTYIPDNYYGLFSEVLKNYPQGIKALVLLDNFDFSILKNIIGLRFLGAPRMSSTLLENVLKLHQKKREKLFENLNIPVLSFKSMNDPKALSWIKENNIDLIANVRTRCIYKRPILEAPKLGCINIHHGLLPKYRGTFCDLYALYEGREAGFTIHQMTPKIDAGQILYKGIVSQGEDKDYLSYLRRTGEIEGKALAQVFKQIEETGIKGEPNTCDTPLFTKNPNKELIKDMLKKGMLL